MLKTAANGFLLFREKDKAWWEVVVPFFDVKKTRAWIMLRRNARSAHHRAEQEVLLRFVGKTELQRLRAVYRFGVLTKHGAVTIYPYPDIDSLIKGESSGGRKAPLPGPGDKPCTERPDCC